MAERRYCKNKCTRYGERVTLYQDGPISPLGVISWRCPECGLYDFEFIKDAEKPESKNQKEDK